MQRIAVLVTLVFLVSPFIATSQKSYYRFIAGYPDYQLDPNLDPDDIDVVYTSGILKLNGDSLIHEITLSDSSHLLYNVRLYHDRKEGTALLAKKRSRYINVPSGEFKLIKLATNRSDTVEIKIQSTIEINDENYDFFPYRIATLSVDTELAFGLQYSNFKIPKESMKPRSIHYTLGSKGGELIPTSPAAYNFIIANGHSICPYLGNNGDGLRLQADTINNVLRIPSGLAVDSVFRTPLPEGVKISKHGGFLVVDDSMVRVLYLYEYSENPAVVTFRIYNKQKKEWKKLIVNTVKDGKLLMKNFDGWLAGASKVQRTKIPWNESNKQPGQEVWSRQRTPYSPSIYEILLAQNRYWFSHGTQYLYNIDSGKYIEWETGQADSEILLVENDIVFYRKYDEIYQVQIQNGEKLGKHELIVKHEYVPAIHFMYRAN